MKAINNNAIIKNQDKWSSGFALVVERGLINYKNDRKAQKKYYDRNKYFIIIEIYDLCKRADVNLHKDAGISEIKYFEHILSNYKITVVINYRVVKQYMKGIAVKW